MDICNLNHPRAGNIPRTAAPPRILVVDDDSATRRLLAVALADAGYVVAAADRGVAAMDAAQTFAPHAVVIDLVMPGMSCLALCQRLQSNPSTARIPVVLCSAISEAAMPAGCRYHTFLAKPVDLERLVGVLRGLTASGAAGPAQALRDRRAAPLR